MDLLLVWLRFMLFRPGMAFMDWLARTYPDIVIRHGIGFTEQSYIFWSGVISAVFWGVLIVGGMLCLRFLRGRLVAARV